MARTERILAVSNRLPVAVTHDDLGNYSYALSSGGLVSALTSLTEINSLWLGWPGLAVPEHHRQSVENDLYEKFRSVPVFLSEELGDLYYNGFSNSILWPLFHYHPGEMNFEDES